MTVDDVLEAVKHGMQREFNKQSKKMTLGQTPVIKEMVAGSAIEVV